MNTPAHPYPYGDDTHDDTFVTHIDGHDIWLRGCGYGYYYSFDGGTSVSILLARNGRRWDAATTIPESVYQCAELHYNLHS